jgi:hypothetical protein
MVDGGGGLREARILIVSSGWLIHRVAAARMVEEERKRKF